MNNGDLVVGKGQEILDSQKQMILQIEDGYSTETRYFVDFLIDRNLSITYQSLIEYQEYLDNHLEPKLKGKTYNQRILAAKNRIRLLFELSPDSLNLAFKTKFYEQLNKIKLIVVDSAIDEELLPSVDEMNILLKNTSKRLSLWIEFLMYTGLRITSAILIEKEDCILNGKSVSIRIKTAKGKKEFKIKTPIELYNRIDDFYKGKTYLFETGGGKPYLRQYVSNEIKKAGKKYLKSNKTLSAHVLRHLFATTALKKGWDLKKIATQLNHSSVSTTADLYTKSIPTIEDINGLYDDHDL